MASRSHRHHVTILQLKTSKMAILNRGSSNKLLLTFLCISFAAGLACYSVAEAISTPTARINRSLSKRSHDKDFAPRFIHQPHSVSVQPNKPHTSECPVESQPESDVKWFKDNKLLENEPMHLEQTGSELMFILVNDRDTGDYHCEATNYLGTVTSEQFRLTVQTSVLDESIVMEPPIHVAREQQEQAAEFKCTIPASYLAKPGGQWRSAGLPQVVSWRKNGKPLQVVWTDANGSGAQDENAPGDSEPQGQRQARFTARQGDRRNEFVLSVVRLTRARDDNSTFTCLYKPEGGGALAAAADSEFSDPEVMAHESRAALLRVEPPSNQRAAVKLDIPMGPPVDLTQAGTNALDSLPAANSSIQNQTTQLQDGTNGNGRSSGQRIRTSLRETLADLYEIAKPTILLFGAMCLLAVIVLIQLLLVRRRSQANRYMKHHHHQYSSASSSSANSNNGAGSGTSATLGATADPVLASLLSRTLSGPSASSLSVNAGKKYKFYRDHMRKVAAITHDQQLVEGADFIDASAYFNQQQQQQQHHLQQDQMLSSQFFPASSALPNLYNQSLAAREQARSLLQTNGLGEHMRSMGNLAASSQLQQKSFVHSRDANHAMHNLELPLNFGLNGRASSSSSSSCAARHEGPLETGASNLISTSNQMVANQFFQSQLAASRQQQQQDQQQHNASGLNDEHYQLVSCSSISPSSTSSIVAGSTNSSSNKHCDKSQTATTTNCEMVTKESVSSNHYSTIDANEEEEEDRYEELEQQQQPHTVGFARTSARSSTASAGNLGNTNQRNQQQQFQARKSTFAAGANANDESGPQTRLRSAMISSTSTDSTSARNVDAFIRDFAPCRTDQRASKFANSSNNSNSNSNNHDQLSPYAVSSICNNLVQQRRDLESSASAAGAQPPPVTSEALQALNEQFDINHLLKFDQATHSIAAPPRLPFSLPPPPTSNSAGLHQQQQQQAQRSRHQIDGHQQQQQ